MSLEKHEGKEGSSTISLLLSFFRLSFFLSCINPSSPFLPPLARPNATTLHPYTHPTSHPSHSYEPDLPSAKRALAVMEARHVLQRVKAQGLDTTNERYGLYYRFVDPWQARWAIV